MRAQAGPQVRGPRAATWSSSAFGSFHGRTLATLHATGQPAEARGVPAAARGLPPRGLARPRRARGGPRPVGGRGAARAGAGRGRREPGHGRVLPGRPAALRRARASSSWSTRCRPASGAPGRGSATSTSASCPTSSRWPRRSATACRSAPAGRKTEVAGGVRARRPRHDLRRPAAGHRRRPRRARRDGGRGRAGASAAGGGAAHRTASSPSTACREVRGLGLLLAARARTATTPGGGRPAPRAAGRSSTPSRPPRCGSPRRCWSPTTRSTMPSPCLARGAVMTAPPPGDRRPHPGGAGAGARPGRRPGAPGACSPQRVGLFFEKPRCAPATRARWRSCSSAGHPSPSARTRSAGRAASRWGTSPTCWPATTPPRCPGVRPPGARDLAAAATIPVVNLLSDTVTRASRSPTCSRCARSGARSPGGRRLGRRLQQRGPRAWPSAPP